MATTLAFPAQEPQFYSRLSLRKYDRWPGSEPSITTEKVIRLPIPETLTDEYGMEVSSVNFPLMGNVPAAVKGIKNFDFSTMMQKGRSFVNQVTEDYKSGNFQVGDMVRSAATFAAIAPGIQDVSRALGIESEATGIAQYAQSVTGVVRNPHITSMFEGVRLKAYNFSWKLAPTSVDEARTINEIIKNIKAYMHPKILYSGYALEYPYMAKLNFEGLNEQTVPNVRDSFITGFHVSGSAAYYKDGQPVTVVLSIQLNEITALTREDFMYDGPSLGAGVR